MRPSSYPLFETVALHHFLEAIAVTWSFLLTNTVFSYPPTSDPPLRLCHHRPAGRCLAAGGPAGKHVLHASSTWVQKSLIAFSGASVSGETHGNVNLSFSWLTYQICSNKTSLPCTRIFFIIIVCRWLFDSSFHVYFRPNWRGRGECWRQVQRRMAAWLIANVSLTSTLTLIIPCVVLFLLEQSRQQGLSGKSSWAYQSRPRGNGPVWVSL